jgi:hypothetical protein
MTGFYDVGLLGEIAINLFHGYGYNFYRDENQLRADDQKARTLVCELLGRARKAVSSAESLFRRERFPTPTRVNPFPPPDIIANARQLETISQAIGGIEGQVRHAPVPENDRMTQRYREEAATLLTLADKDKLLIGQAAKLCTLVEGKTPDAILAALAEIGEGVEAITMTLSERRLLTL